MQRVVQRSRGPFARRTLRTSEHGSGGSANPPPRSPTSGETHQIHRGRTATIGARPPNPLNLLATRTTLDPAMYYMMEGFDSPRMSAHDGSIGQSGGRRAGIVKRRRGLSAERRRWGRRQGWERSSSSPWKWRVALPVVTKVVRWRWARVEVRRRWRAIGPRMGGVVSLVLDRHATLPFCSIAMPSMWGGATS